LHQEKAFEPFSGLKPKSTIVSSDSTVRREAEINERALLYVSATRAKREVQVSCFGKPSAYLEQYLAEVKDKSK
jgi:superfamily I DNA/RNA helicase